MGLYSDEEFQFGTDPELCPYCHESLTGMCKFHRELEKKHLLSDDVHDWAEQQKIGKDIADEARRERNR